MTRLRSAQPESSVERFFLRQSLQLANSQAAGALPDSVELEGTEAHHLLHVLRAKVGDRLGLFNGAGAEALTEIVNIRKRSAELRLLETWSIPAESRTLTIAAAMPKGDRARWLIEKSTELGVTRLIPLRTQRSVVEPGESKMDKLEQAVIAACKQCGRSHLMTISPLMPFGKLLKELTPDRAHVDQPERASVRFSHEQSHEPDASAFRLIIAHPSAQFSVSAVFSQIANTSITPITSGEPGGISPRTSVQPVRGLTPPGSPDFIGTPLSLSDNGSQTNAQSALMLIGPEGGFTDDEFSAAVTAGAIPVNLGPHILRIETAAIAVAAAWRFAK